MSTDDFLDTRALYVHEHNFGDVVRNCGGGSFPHSYVGPSVDEVVEEFSDAINEENTSVFYLLFPEYHVPAFAGSKLFPIYTKLPEKNQWPEWLHMLPKHDLAWDADY